MIIGIEGSFRLKMGWIFPTHKDFKLMTFTLILSVISF